MTDDTTPNLPEPVPQLAAGTLTLADLDEATRGLRARIQEQLDRHVQHLRDQRRAAIGTATPTEGDIAPAVRELGNAADVFDRIAGDFKAVATAAREHITDEAQATGLARVVVVDGDTQIVVSPGNKTETEFDPAALAGVLGFGASQAWGDDSTPDKPTGPLAAPPSMDAEASLRWAYQQGFIEGFLTVEEYGRIEWRITNWKALIKRLMSAAEDALAAAVARSFTRTTKPGPLKVERKEYKP